MADLSPESFATIATTISTKSVTRSDRGAGAAATTLSSRAAATIGGLVSLWTAYRFCKYYWAGHPTDGPAPSNQQPETRSPMPAAAAARQSAPPRPMRRTTSAPKKDVPPAAVGDSEYLRFPSQRLGSGAYGSVFAGIHSVSGEYVAVKELHNVADTEALRREYELMIQLAHPCIVGIRALVVDYETSVTSLVLERCEKSLLAQLEETGAFPEQRVRIVARQMLLGLECLHSQRILHRDVKPANVLVDGAGKLKLADFGVSRQTDQTVVQTMHLAGSPVFLSPEATAGRFSPGSDLWALGATLTQLLTAKTPWSHVPECMTSALNCMRHIGTVPSDPAEAALHHPQFPESLSPEAQDFFRILFAQDPDARTSCHDLLAHPFVMGAGGVPITVDNFASDIRRSQPR